jgi:hypothetical protein
VANELTMVRGDTLIIAVNVFDENGAAYNPAVDDEIIFTVREWSDEGEIALQYDQDDTNVSIVTGGWEITIDPEDTADLEYIGYVYDIEVTLADGYKQTIIPYASFTLTREVTYVDPVVP